MVGIDRPQWRLTPSQQEQGDAIRTRLSAPHGQHRPLLLTGDVGVGKTYLAHNLAQDPTVYQNIAQDYMHRVLAACGLADLTPEAVVRLVKELIEDTKSPVAIIDGLEPLVSLWTVERPRLLPNFFVALSRVILDRPWLVVIRTSEHLPVEQLQQAGWWPWERYFRLELTAADREVVARNWNLDPMRGRVSSNLYQLLAARQDRKGGT